MKKVLAVLLALLTTGAVFAQGGSEAQSQQLVLKVGTRAPESSTFVSNAKIFTKKLEELSNGTMTTDIVAGGALGNIPQHFSQLTAGTLDLFIQGLDAPAAVKGGEDFSILNVPFLFDDTEHFHAFVKSAAFESMMDKVRGNGNKFQFLGLIGDRPPRSLSTKNTAVRKPANLNGLVIRVSESAIPMEVWKAWGANVTTSSAAAIFEGLQTGQFDGQENGIESMVVDGYMNVQNYYMVFEWMQQGIAVFISDATKEKLTEQQYAWVKEALDYTLKTTSDALWNGEVAGYYKILKDKGVNIIDDVDIDEFRAIVDRLVPQFEGKYFRKGLYEEIRALAK